MEYQWDFPWRRVNNCVRLAICIFFQIFPRFSFVFNSHWQVVNNCRISVRPFLTSASSPSPLKGMTDVTRPAPSWLWSIQNCWMNGRNLARTYSSRTKRSPYAWATPTGGYAWPNCLWLTQTRSFLTWPRPMEKSARPFLWSANERVNLKAMASLNMCRARLRRRPGTYWTDGLSPAEAMTSINSIVIGSILRTFPLAACIPRLCMWTICRPTLGMIFFWSISLEFVFKTKPIRAPSQFFKTKINQSALLLSFSKQTN